MALYHYQALNAEQQPVAGEIEAGSVSQAVALLESQGLTLQAIGSAAARSASEQERATGTNPFTAGYVYSRERAERAVLQRHMEQVIERSRTLIPALRAYAKELPSGRRRRQLGAAIRILERGDATEAAKTLDSLPGYWIPLLSAAASSQDAGRVLREFLAESQRAEDLSRQWWLTLTYPLLLAGLALAVMTALSFFVVPIFRNIMEGFGLQLPWLTTTVFATADSITSGRLLVVLVAVLIVGYLLIRAARWLPASVREWFGDRWGIRWGRSTAIARFSQFTADLLEAELAMPHALRLAGIATDRGPVRRAAWRVAGDLEAGNAVTLPTNRRILTATVLNSLWSEMPTTSRIRLLSEISSCYADRAHLRLSWTRGIMEPIAIVVIGLLVGATVLALFMPLISLVQGLG